MQSNKDPSSLNNLNGIVLPPEVPWWPLAPGWHVLTGVLLLLLCWFLVRTFQRYRRNRYRRQGLVELNSLRMAGATDSVMGVPPLLKRVALAAYPREIVASVTGRDWARLLDSAAGTDDFECHIGALLDQAAYQSDLLDETGRNELFRAAEQWIMTHRVEVFDQ